MAIWRHSDPSHTAHAGKAGVEHTSMAAAPQLPSPIAALYLQSVALPLSSLAAANGNEAKAVCDSLRTALSSSQLNTLNINAVTAAAESLCCEPSAVR